MLWDVARQLIGQVVDYHHVDGMVLSERFWLPFPGRKNGISNRRRRRVEGIEDTGAISQTTSAITCILKSSRRISSLVKNAGAFIPANAIDHYIGSTR